MIFCRRVFPMSSHSPGELGIKGNVDFSFPEEDACVIGDVDEMES